MTSDGVDDVADFSLMSHRSNAKARWVISELRYGNCWDLYVVSGGITANLPGLIDQSATEKST